MRAITVAGYTPPPSTTTSSYGCTPPHPRQGVMRIVEPTPEVAQLPCHSSARRA